MVGYYYNVYGPGRTRPHITSEAHWRNMGIKLGMQMRSVPVDPAHQVDPLMRYRMAGRCRQGLEAKAAF